jgi:hypothetical protein
MIRIEGRRSDVQAVNVQIDVRQYGKDLENVSTSTIILAGTYPGIMDINGRMLVLDFIMRWEIVQ